MPEQENQGKSLPPYSWCQAINMDLSASIQVEASIRIWIITDQITHCLQFPDRVDTAREQAPPAKLERRAGNGHTTTSLKKNINAHCVS
jgi:hypothetical protein